MTGGSLWYDTVGREDVLLTAPPGCGKTHHLAHLVRGLIERNHVAAPQQILAATFSTKAKANLQSRIGELCSPSQMQRVHVTNFHGICYRLYRAHAATIGLDPEAKLPVPGSLAVQRSMAANAYNVNAYELQRLIDEAKAGSFDQDEALERLHRFAGQAGVTYELGLRSANQLDYSDAIRHALRLLRTPGIAELYNARFPVVVVDECQDLTRNQFEIAELLSGEAMVLAGDRAQGIYRFARADPEWVYKKMRDRRPHEEVLSSSHRSSPAVLEIVSAVARQLGGESLTCAAPEKWADGGTSRTYRFTDTWQEADHLLELINADLLANPHATIGVISRTAWRRRELEAAARAANLDYELWDHPVHKPAAVRLLRRHIGTAIARHANDQERLDELYILCFGSCGQDDLETLDELNAAFEKIEQLMEGRPLAQIIADVRTATDDLHPVPSGLHFLTGHGGKGQQFDHVYVIGLEEGILPDSRSTSDDKLRDELAVLHVMVSRARHSITISCARDVRWDINRQWNRQPSRWLELLEDASNRGMAERHETPPD